MRIPYGIAPAEYHDGKVISFIVSAQYLNWLASMLNESCHCKPHNNHSECLEQETIFLEFIKEMTGVIE